MQYKKFKIKIYVQYLENLKLLLIRGLTFIRNFIYNFKICKVTIKVNILFFKEYHLKGFIQ